MLADNVKGRVRIHEPGRQQHTLTGQTNWPAYNEVENVMNLLGLQAFLELIHFDLYLMRGDFPALYERLRKSQLGMKVASEDVVDKICAAIDLACIWYWKEALCLQRSAATACLLKRYGVSAELVIGAQRMPFKAHAWVEVDRQVINDKPYMPEICMVLDRC